MTRRTHCPNCGATHLVVGEWPAKLKCISCEQKFIPSLGDVDASRERAKTAPEERTAAPEPIAPPSLKPTRSQLGVPLAVVLGLTLGGVTFALLYQAFGFTPGFDLDAAAAWRRAVYADSEREESAAPMISAQPALAAPLVADVASVLPTNLDADVYHEFAQLASHSARCGETKIGDVPLLSGTLRALAIAQSDSHAFDDAAQQLILAYAHCFKSLGLPMEASSAPQVAPAQRLIASLEGSWRQSPDVDQIKARLTQTSPAAWLSDAGPHGASPTSRTQFELQRRIAWGMARRVMLERGQSRPLPNDPKPTVSIRLGNRATLIDPRAPLPTSYAVSMTHSSPTPLRRSTIEVTFNVRGDRSNRGYYYIETWPPRTPLILDPLPGWEDRGPERIADLTWAVWSIDRPTLQGRETYLDDSGSTRVPRAPSPTTSPSPRHVLFGLTQEHDRR